MSYDKKGMGMIRIWVTEIFLPHILSMVLAALQSLYIAILMSSLWNLYIPDLSLYIAIGTCIIYRHVYTHPYR